MKLKSSKPQLKFSHIAMLADFENEHNISIIEVLKVGKVLDRAFQITSKMLNDYVKNFDEGVYGTEIQVNLGHNREGEAAGWIRSLFRVEDTLLAEVEWTPLGMEKIKTKQYRFTSSELSSVLHHETGKTIENVLIGVGLTNIPAVKGLAAVSLSEEVQNLINQTNMSKDQKLNEEVEETTEEVEETEVVETEEETTEEVEEGTEEETTEEVEAELAEVPDFIKKKIEDKKKKESGSKGGKEEEKEEKEMSLEDMKKQKKKLEEKIAAMEKKKAMSSDKKLSENLGMVALSEFQALQEKANNLEEQLKSKELSETLKTDFLLSEGSNSGYFAPSDKEDVKVFLSSLDSEQIEMFKSLLGKVKTVEFGVKGVSKTSTIKLSGDLETDVVALSNSLLESGKAKDIFEAQEMANEQLNK